MATAERTPGVKAQLAGKADPRAAALESLLMPARTTVSAPHATRTP